MFWGIFPFWGLFWKTLFGVTFCLFGHGFVIFSCLGVHWPFFMYFTRKIIPTIGPQKDNFWQFRYYFQKWPTTGPKKDPSAPYGLRTYWNQTLDLLTEGAVFCCCVLVVFGGHKNVQRNSFGSFLVGKRFEQWICNIIVLGFFLGSVFYFWGGWVHFWDHFGGEDVPQPLYFLFTGF